MRISDWSSDVCSSDLEAAAMAVTDQHGDEVDGFGDERARHGHHRFLDELLHPAQRTQCATGMDGADASGMTGAPGFEKIKRLGPAHLADGDAIRAQAER